MKLIHILLFISPLFVFAILFIRAITLDGVWCFNNECTVGAGWAGSLTAEWIVFYGIPASGYLIYRKIKQRSKKKFDQQ